MDPYENLYELTAPTPEYLYDPPDPNVWEWDSQNRWWFPKKLLDETPSGDGYALPSNATPHTDGEKRMSPKASTAQASSLMWPVGPASLFSAVLPTICFWGLATGALNAMILMNMPISIFFGGLSSLTGDTGMSEPCFLCREKSRTHQEAEES